MLEYEQPLQKLNFLYCVVFAVTTRLDMRRTANGAQTENYEKEIFWVAIYNGALNVCVTTSFLPIKILIAQIFSITLYNNAAPIWVTHHSGTYTN